MGDKVMFREVNKDLDSLDTALCTLHCWEYNACGNKIRCRMEGNEDKLCWVTSGSIESGDKSCLAFTSHLTDTCVECNFYKLMQTVDKTHTLLKELKNYLALAGVQTLEANKK